MPTSSHTPPRPRTRLWANLTGPLALLTLAACAPLPPAAPPSGTVSRTAPAANRPSGHTAQQTPNRPQPSALVAAVSARLARLGAADMLLLGEQHDAPEHQQLHLAVVTELIQANELAALVLEMADSGHHTRALPAHASEAQVQQALRWRESAWPWSAYGPAVMAAVAAGVPVLGGNLPREHNGRVMHQTAWDTRIPAAALASQRQAVAEGHCLLLPDSQITPMTRIQLARDASLAQTMTTALKPGKTVLLLTGSQHADKALGVPLHLGGTRIKVKTVRLDASGPRPGDAQSFDAVWPTAPVPPRDHCAELRGS